MSKSISFILCGIMMMFAAMGTALAQTSGTAGGNSKATLFFEDFESAQAPLFPAGWTTVANPASDTWKTGKRGSFEAHSGYQYAYIVYNSSYAHDSWVFTPGMSMEAGAEYTVSFWVQLRGYGGDHEALEVKIGNAATVDAMTVSVYNENDQEITTWQQVTYSFTPTASDTYYIGFHCYSPADLNTTMFDDLMVSFQPEGPYFEGATTLAFGRVMDIDPAKERTYRIVNPGTEELTVSLTSNSPELTVTNVPSSVAAKDTAYVTVTLNRDDVGNYEGNFVLATNDPARASVTVNVTASISLTTLTGYSFQDFEAGFPAGWGNAGFEVDAGSGVNGSTAIRANVASSTGYSRYMLTHWVRLEDNPGISFSYRALNFSGGEPTPANQVEITVEVTNNYNDQSISFTQVYPIIPGTDNEHVPSADYATVNVPLPDYAGKAARVLIIAKPVNDCNYWLYIDNLSAGTKPANNLSALSVTGTAFPTVGVATPYTVTVRNTGSNTQTSYTVKLMKDDGTMIAELPGVSIAEGETKPFEFAWTPEAEGTVGLYAEVVLDADEDALDNKTGTRTVTVLPEGITGKTIGDGKINYYSPIDFSYNNSASQTLYLASDMQTNSGLITHIYHQTSFAAAASSNASVKMWIGETDRTDFLLDKTWIPISELTPIFDGTLNLPAGESYWVVELPEPYEYKGGNLVIYTFKSDTEYSFGQYFLATSVPESGRALRRNSDAAMTHEDPGAAYAAHYYPNVTFLMDFGDMGGITGTVTGTNGLPVEGVKIEAAGTPLFDITDAAGKYSFPHLTAGAYTLKATKFGYGDEEAEVTVANGQTATQNFTVASFLKVTVSGSVTRSDSGNPIEGAAIALAGYENYETVTGADGTYSIAGVYANNNYEMTVFADGFAAHAETLEVAETDVTKNVAMNEIPLPVVAVSATPTENDTKVQVEWYAPNGDRIQNFRYDSGVKVTEIGGNGMFPNYVIGSVHRVPATLVEMSWFCSDKAPASASIVVFGLDAQGEPINSVLYRADNLPNIHEQWNTHVFPEPVNAPNGFMIALANSYGHMGLGLSQPTAEHPYVNGANYYSGDITKPTVYPFTTFEAGGVATFANCMVRAVGITGGKALTFDHSNARRSGSHVSQPEAGNIVPIAATPVETGNAGYISMKSAPKVLVGYSVYRLAAGQEQNETAWETLSAAHADTCYVDNTWEGLEAGVYRYAVKASYTGQQSPARFSKEMGKNMEAQVTINLTANSDDPVNGAVVKLTNEDGNTDHTYTMTANTGTVVFPKVWKGTYSLSATLAGFEAYAQTDIVINDDKSLDVELTEAIVTPYGLKIEETGNDTERLFLWNKTFNFEDSFEDQTFDAWGEFVRGTGTPGEGGNPFWHVRSGDIYEYGAYDGAYMAQTDWGYDIDSWIITPAIDITAETSLSFAFLTSYSWHVEDATGDLWVKVSTDDGETWTSIWHEEDYGEFEDFAWYEVNLGLSAYAGQTVLIAFNMVGDDNASMNLDAVKISGAKRTRSFTEYIVYLDDENGKVAGGLTDTRYTLTNLANGTHKAGVKAVYTSGESPVVWSEPFVVTGAGISGNTLANITVYGSGNNVHIANPHSISLKSVQIADALGRVVYDGKTNASVTIPVNSASGIYVVRLISDDNKVLSTKVHLN
jgi:hypothetical protein